MTDDLLEAAANGDQDAQRIGLKPATVSKEELLNVLNALVKLVENDDSIGGWVQYNWSESQDPVDQYDVSGVIRHGNSLGQGSTFVIGGV